MGVAGVEAYEYVGLLRSVAIAPTFQRRGIGKLLVGRLLEEVRQRGIGRVYLLTTTASDYFRLLGFKAESMKNVPQALHASAEFQGACPASAVLMPMAL